VPGDLHHRLGRQLLPATGIGARGLARHRDRFTTSCAGVANSTPVAAGATVSVRWDAGNTPIEVFVAVCQRMGIETGIDLFKVMDVAEDIVVPLMGTPVRVDRESLTIGFAGCYSTFLLFARRAAERYGIDARELLVEMGRRKMIAGQEDMIEDVAMTMAKDRGLFVDAASTLTTVS
jgi:4-hydroxy-2-oxovalerate/4-hydroxy-2-oxohexanoate aldolase